MKADHKAGMFEARTLIAKDVMDLLGALMKGSGEAVMESTKGRNPATRVVRDALGYAFGALEDPPDFDGSESWGSREERELVAFARKVSGPQKAGELFEVDESASGALADSLNFGISRGLLRWPSVAHEAREMARASSAELVSEPNGARSGALRI
jgi:DNA helicase HerA-like ATPase